jgi:hypothetical protein
MNTKQNRRKFIATAAVFTTGIAAYGLSTDTMEKKQHLIHQVFFWLKNPASTEDRDKLITGLQKLSKIETIRTLHIGIPASTEKRDVVDSSFSVSELMFFDDEAGQKIYQDHPLHQQFMATCGHLWEKVLVYDSKVLE